MKEATAMQVLSTVWKLVTTVLLLSSHKYYCRGYSTGQDQIDWLRTIPGGFFSDKIVWKRSDENDPKSMHGMFAVQDVQKGETLMVIPRKALITSDGYNNNCVTVYNLLEEYKKGTDSEYYPYIDYLFGDESNRGLLPSAWSKRGKYLITKLVGRDLLPTYPCIHDTAKGCPDIPNDKNNVTQLENDAYMHMVSRSWDDVMIPGELFLEINRIIP
jgi:hypothetical protein